MAKQRRRTSVWFMKKSKAQAWMDQADWLIGEEDPEGALKILCRVIKMVPPDSVEYSEAMNLIGVSMVCLEEFDVAFGAFSVALDAFPGFSPILFNRGLVGHQTARSCQSVMDFEEALRDGEMDEQLRDDARQALRISRRLVKEEIRLRGNGFTFEELHEIQDIHALARLRLEDEEYASAEMLLRRAIELDRDAVPEVWGSLGFCLMMQEQYGEAEEAFRHSLKIEPEYHPAEWGLKQLAQLRDGRLSLSDCAASAATSAA